MQTRFLTGNKDAIPGKITDGTIIPGDFIVTKDTDELCFIDKQSEQNFIKCRSENAYTLNGTSLGALEDGATIPVGISLDELLNLITKKAVHPDYIAPVVSIAKAATGTAGGSYEAGTAIQPDFVATYTKNDGGDMTNIEILKKVGAAAAISISNGTVSPFNEDGAEFILGDETIAYIAKATYAQGPVKQNNLGEDDPVGQILPGSKESAAITYKGFRKAFFGSGVGAAGIIDSGKVRALNGTLNAPVVNSSFTFTVPVGSQHIIFAYPANLRDVHEVLYVNLNDNSMAANFTKSEVNVADARGGAEGMMPYKVYVYETAGPTEAEMTFKITI